MVIIKLFVTNETIVRRYIYVLDIGIVPISLTLAIGRFILHAVSVANHGWTALIDAIDGRTRRADRRSRRVVEADDEQSTSR